MTFAFSSLPVTLAAEGGFRWGPWTILALCVLAGIGTVLLLPGRRSVGWRKAGGGLLLAAGIFAAVAAFNAFGYTNVYFWAFSIIAILGSLRVITHPKPVYSALYFVLTVFASAGLFVLLWAEFMAVALIIIYAGAILVTYTFVIMLAADAAAPNQSSDEAAREFLAEHDRYARAPWAAAVAGFVTMGLLLFTVFERAPEALERRGSLTDPVFLTPSPDLVRGMQGGALGRSVFDEQFVGSVTPERVGGEAARPGPRGDLWPTGEQPAWSQLRGGVQTLGIYLFTRQIVSLQIAGLILTVAMIGAIVIARKQVLTPEGRTAGEAMTGPGEPGEVRVGPFTPVDDNPKSLPVIGTGNPRQKAYPQN